MKTSRRLLGALTLSLALVLFVVMVRRAGLSEIVERAGSLGFGFLLLLLIAGLRVATRAAAWMVCLPESERQIGFLALLNARLVGDTAGHLTPAGPLVAEPARLAALGRRIPFATSLHALAVETITYSVSSCLVVLGGIIVMLGSFALSRQIREAGLIASLAILILLALTVLIVLRRWTILSGLGEWARRGLHLVGFSKRWKRQVAHLRTFENYVFQFYRVRQIDFLRMVGLEAIFHLLGVVETWLALDLLGFKATLVVAFVLEATNRAVNILFSFVPGRVGVDEAGSGVLAEILGLGGAAGVMIALVRKARILFWTAVGMILLAARRR